MRTRTCERCDGPFEPGQEIESISRDAISGARPNVWLHRVCPPRHERLPRGLPSVPATPRRG
ncbi:hypothetical protein GA0115252_13817 [Streptomyces sp. DfronAA-171]|nr:hypothetical protein GA0115252_13817 [Streptomyces sp. DfronAA-171]